MLFRALIVSLDYLWYSVVILSKEVTNFCTSKRNNYAHDHLICCCCCCCCCCIRRGCCLVKYVWTRNESIKILLSVQLNVFSQRMSRWKKELSRKRTCLQFLLCLFCMCNFIGLVYHISMKRNLFCWRK